jgi:hypothetical protein
MQTIAYAPSLATGLGTIAKKKNAENYSEIIKALVPLAIRLAGIFGDQGITASTIRRHGVNVGIIKETTPLHFLSSVMKQANLVTNGATRASTNPASKGRRQLIYFAAPGPYTD